VRLVADFAPEDVEFETETEMVEVQGSYVQEAMGPQGPIATVAPAVEMQEQQVPVGIQAIRRGSYFVSFTFIPSFDGKFHGTGFGALLGDISEAINTIINMMLDAGHYASLGGGFIGSGLRLRGGSSILAPGQYKNVQAQGMAIRENIVDRTFPGPDPTLFQLLGLLIEAGREVASVKDIMTGDAGPRQETATAMLARMEQGMAVFTASYKRIFRAIKEELRLLTQINARTVDAEAYTAFHDAMDQMGQPQMLDPAQDFSLSDMDIEPVADPRSVTKMQMAAEAQFLLELAQGGLVNVGPAVARMLEAMDIRDTEELAPQPDPMAGPMAEMQMEAAHADLVLKKVQVEKVLAEIESERAKAVKDMTDAEATRREQQLSAIEISLKDERERLNAVIQGRNQRMAAQSRNGGAVSRGGGGTGSQGAGDALDVLEQQARALAAGGAASGAGFGAGPF
jgi:chaperonin GroES